MVRQWDDRDLIIRTLSAPDLAQQQQLLKFYEEQQQKQDRREK